jgi:hypothetical protein
MSVADSTFRMLLVKFACPNATAFFAVTISIAAYLRDQVAAFAIG